MAIYVTQLLYKYTALTLPPTLAKQPHWRSNALEGIKFLQLGYPFTTNGMRETIIIVNKMPCLRA